MNESPRGPRAGVPGPTLRFVLAAIVVACFLFPPETRGESAVGCALLVFLLALLTARGVPLLACTALGVALAAAWPLSLLSLAPGLAPPPVATALLAATAGVCAASRSSDLRKSAALPAALAAVATLVSLYALYQLFHGLDAAARSVEGASGLPDRELVLARLRAGRAFAAFATPAALGGFLALSLPVTVALALGGGGRRRWLPAAGGALQAAALAATASASAAGALLAAIVLLLVRRGGRGRLLAALGGVVVVIGIIVAVRGTTVIDPTDPESPWRLRAGNARVALAIVADHPWTGVGPGAFGEAYPAYRRPGDNETRHAHDLPLELLAEFGLPIGCGLAALFYWLFLGPLLSRAPAEPGWIAGVRVGLAAFALHNLVDFTAAFPSFLLAAAVLRAACAGDHPGEPDAGRARAWMLVPVATALLAGAIVAGSGLAWNARVAARSDTALAGDPVLADAGTSRAMKVAPWDPDARMLRAEFLLRSSKLASALVEAEAAVRSTPIRASARALRARVRLALGDLPGAFADLDLAARLYPIRPEYSRDRDALASHLPDPKRAETQR